MVSPGVLTREVDYSTYVGQVSTAILGIVGGATKGPINEKTYITSAKKFISIFGEPTGQTLGAYAALEFLKEGNQLWYVRVASDSAAKSFVTFSGSDGTEDISVLKIEALTEGTEGNNITAEVSDVEDLDFTLKIYYKDELVETYNASLDPLSDKFIEDIIGASEYVTAEDVSEGTAISLTGGVKALRGGNDGLDDIEPSDFIGTPGSEEGLQIFRNAEAVDINILAVPGYSAMGSIAAEIINICESRGDCIGLIDPPLAYDPASVVDWRNGKAYDEIDAPDNPQSALNSSYAATYSTWIKVYDSFTSSEIYLPPSGFIAAKFAYNDRVSYSWFAPAGLKRGRITTALDVEYSPDAGERDLLYENNINPIVNFSGDGVTIWGQKTLQTMPSATDRINVRRLLLMIRKAIAATTRYLTFDPNDEFLWNEWKGLIEPYLDSIKSRRGLYDYKVLMSDDTTITDSDIDQNRMPGRVLIKPTKSAEFIPIDFVLYATGAEFTE